MPEEVDTDGSLVFEGQSHRTPELHRLAALIYFISKSRDNSLWAPIDFAHALYLNILFGDIGLVDTQRILLEFYSVDHFATRRLRTFSDPYGLERSAGTPQQSRTLCIWNYSVSY